MDVVRKMLEAVVPGLVVSLSLGVGFASAVGNSARSFSISEKEEVLRNVGILWVEAERRESSEVSRLQGNVIRSVAAEKNVYEAFGDMFPSNPSWLAEPNLPGARFGWSVASAGDVNGDGYSDVIVGAPLYHDGEESEGWAFVYHGSASGLSSTVAWTADSDQAGAQFGISVGHAGDVNNDGYSDVIVGANLYEDGQTWEGRAYVYHGGPSGLSSTPAWTDEGDSSDARFGVSVACAGDVNNDGYSDVIVGASHYADSPYWGRAFVYHGGPSGLSEAPACTLKGTDGLFGLSVAGAGDVNGDGYSDVVVGEPVFDILWKGRAWVFHGSPTGLLDTPAWTADGVDENAFFGRSVASAGDINGDGYSDVIVGEPYYVGVLIIYGDGRAHAYAGSDTGLSATAGWTGECDQQLSAFGYSVSGAGDVNGDGCSEVIVGAFAYHTPLQNSGRAFAYAGGDTGLSATCSWMGEGDQENALFGHSVASAGDVNGDAHQDVVVGAYLYDNGEVDEGRAYVYHGTPQPEIVPVSGFLVTLLAVALGVLAAVTLTKRRLGLKGLR